MTKSTEKSDSKKRYIAFVGNLSFTTTVDSVTAMFPSATSVRLMSDKVTKKSRGAAFVEFATPNELQEAIKMTGKELDGRKIRVEPTVGGGGKSETRKEKLKVKKETWKNSATKN
jgi:nucleolar protein 6